MIRRCLIEHTVVTTLADRVEFFSMWYTMKEELLLFICSEQKSLPHSDIGEFMRIMFSIFFLFYFSYFLLAITNYFLVRDFLFLCTAQYRERNFFFGWVHESFQQWKLNFLSTILGILSKEKKNLGQEMTWAE